MTSGVPFFLVLSAGLAGRLLAAESPPLTRSPFSSQGALPALVAYATHHRIPVEGMTLAAAGTPAAKGDQVSMLLSLEKSGALQQWLVRLERDDLTGDERSLKPWPEEVMHTSTGRELRYAASPAALRVEFIGPFGPGTNGPPPVSRQARTLVSREYLELGLAHYCESALQIQPRLQAAGIAEPLFYGGSGVPSAEAVTRGRQAAAAFGLTAEEERLAFSVYFALRTFFTAALEVPACQEVLEQVIQKPSVWSVLSRFGVRTGFKYGWQDVRAVPGGQVAFSQPVYLFPLRVSLNDTLAVKATLAVTPPKPPLQAAAGLFALCAEHPSIPDRRLYLRVLSAGRATPHGPVPPAP